MPTLASQDLIRVRIQPGEALTVSCTSPATCTLTEFNTAAVPLTPVTLSNAVNVIGPFSTARQYLLQANLGGITYSMGPMDPLAEERTAFQSAVGVAGAADTNENTLATQTIPGGSMGANGCLIVTCLWAVNNNANVKTLRVKFGGTNFMTVAGASLVSLKTVVHIWNRNAQNSQVCQDPLITGFGTSTAAVATASIDTSADQTLLITGQKATGGDTLRLEAYSIQLAYGA